MADGKESPKDRPVIVRRPVIKSDAKPVEAETPRLAAAGRKVEPLNPSGRTSSELDIPGLPPTVTGKKETATPAADAPEPSGSADTSKDSVPEPEPQPEPEAKADPEAKPAEPRPETDVSQDGDDSATSEADDTPSKKGAAALPGVDQEAQETAKLTELTEKLVESKQYFLPINSAEKRRSKRFVITGVLLSVLLLLAWFNIALDASIIKIDGIEPVTHFFSS